MAVTSYQMKELTGTRTTCQFYTCFVRIPVTGIMWSLTTEWHYSWGLAPSNLNASCMHASQDINTTPQISSHVSQDQVNESPVPVCLHTNFDLTWSLLKIFTFREFFTVLSPTSFICFSLNVLLLYRWCHLAVSKPGIHIREDDMAIEI